MEFQIKNIWKIKDAKVDLNWLTVIAWDNDSWKSTVSKIIFSVIKAIQKHKDFSEVSKEKVIEKEVESMYSISRAIYGVIKKNNEKLAIEIFKVLKSEFEPSVFLDQLKINDINIIIALKKDIINNVDFWNEKNFRQIFLNEVNASLIKIEKEFNNEDSKEYLVEKALNSILLKEFKWQINSFNNNQSWEIKISDGWLLLFRILIKDNTVKKIKIHDSILWIKDTTFIDTPIILNLFNELNFTNLQTHIKDLFNKIVHLKTIDNTSSQVSSFEKKIKLIMWGVFKVSKHAIGNYLSFFKAKTNINIETINTATWIKSFWILQLLDNAWNLSESDLLILDEPESHLHPAWQIKYAELIISLIKERKLKVLVTSHSPYMIEAFNKYSNNYKIKDKCSYYFIDDKNNFNNVTNKRDVIINEMSKPFDEIIFDN